MRAYDVYVSESTKQSTPYAKVTIFDHPEDGKCEIIFDHEIRLKAGAIPEIDDDSDVDKMGVVIGAMVAALNQWHENECHCPNMIGVGAKCPANSARSSSTEVKLF